MNFCLHSSARTIEQAVVRAQRAEALGFEAIFLADSQMNNVDPYQALALCAVNTSRIQLGTAVTNMVYRDPTIAANSFATLNEISHGRAIIGMGTGDGPVYSFGRAATKLVREQLERACDIVSAQRECIDRLVDALLERDTLLGPEIRDCFDSSTPRN